jgi:hypothetical protein
VQWYIRFGQWRQKELLKVIGLMHLLGCPPSRGSSSPNCSDQPLLKPYLQLRLLLFFPLQQKPPYAAGLQLAAISVSLSQHFLQTLNANAKRIFSNILQTVKSYFFDNIYYSPIDSH